MLSFAKISYLKNSAMATVTIPRNSHFVITLSKNHLQMFVAGDVSSFCVRHRVSSIQSDTLHCSVSINLPNVYLLASVILFRFLFLNLLSGIESWVNPANYHGRERLKSTTLDGSLYLQSLAVRLEGHKIKNLHKSLHNYLSLTYFVSISFSWICWVKSNCEIIHQIFMTEINLRQEPRLWKAASTCRAWLWG